MFVDTAIENQVDLYILHQNSEMKRFTAKVYEDGSSLRFEEYAHSYNISQVFVDKAATGATN
jgi:hypothetical protein